MLFLCLFQTATGSFRRMGLRRIPTPLSRDLSSQAVLVTLLWGWGCSPFSIEMILVSRTRITHWQLMACACSYSAPYSLFLFSFSGLSGLICQRSLLLYSAEGRSLIVPAGRTKSSWCRLRFRTMICLELRSVQCVLPDSLSLLTTRAHSDQTRSHSWLLLMQHSCKGSTLMSEAGYRLAISYPILLLLVFDSRPNPNKLKCIYGVLGFWGFEVWG